MSNNKPLTTFRVVMEVPQSPLSCLPVNTVFRMNGGGNVYVKTGNGAMGTGMCDVHCIHNEGKNLAVRHLEGATTAFRIAKNVEVTFE